jgi:hypothetical protein
MNTSLVTDIDHIVIGANSLVEGRNYIYQTLGVYPETGGEHIAMGTHNCLLKLGNSIYLEVIAINRSSVQPDRPHWFGLDKSSPNVKPKLLTWVARTNHIHMAVKKSKIHFGEIEEMKRGDFEWLITVLSDGTTPMDGIAPTLIQWKTHQFPAASLPESGCSLIRIEGYHHKAKMINEDLRSIGFEGVVSLKKSRINNAPYLIAYIQTQKGVVELIS